MSAGGLVKKILIYGESLILNANLSNRHSREGGNPFLKWTPAFARVTNKITNNRWLDFYQELAEEVGVEPKGTFNALHRF